MSEGSGLPAPLSASKLKTFDRCPEEFRLKYVERLPPEGGENRYLRRGNAVHEAIEDYLDDAPAEYPDEDGVAFALKRRYWDNGGKESYELSAEDDDFVLDCLEVAGRYIAKQSPDIVSVEASVPFGTDEVDHAYGFGGFADVVTETEVWDWKTGKSEGKNLDETLQGAVYVAGFVHHMGRLPESVRFVYLKEEKVRSREPSDELYQTMVSKAESLLSAVDFGQFPAQPDPSKCYFCDFEVHCAASPVGGGNIDWESYP